MIQDLGWTCQKSNFYSSNVCMSVPLPFSLALLFQVRCAIFGQPAVVQFAKVPTFNKIEDPGVWPKFQKTLSLSFGHFRFQAPAMAESSPTRRLPVTSCALLSRRHCRSRSHLQASPCSAPTGAPGSGLTAQPSPSTTGASAATRWTGTPRCQD